MVSGPRQSAANRRLPRTIIASTRTAARMISIVVYFLRYGRGGDLTWLTTKASIAALLSFSTDSWNRDDPWLLRLLDRRAIEDQQLANRAGQTQPHRDQQTRPAGVPVLPENQPIQAEPPCAQRRHGDRADRQHQVVLPA